MHVAIIMDGNGRWAKRQGLPRAFGHRAGAHRVEECVRAAPSIGISSMTLYAFSTENWKRPKYEITAIFRLFRVFFRRKAEELKSENVRVRFIGRRDNLSQQVLETVNWVENLTSDCTGLNLNIAIDYGGRNELVRIIEKVVADSAAGTLCSPIDEQAITARSDLPLGPPPDLIIRTGGDRRISNFLLWHIAYSELDFVDKLWPDFSDNDLGAAVDRFRARSRRYGGV